MKIKTSIACAFGVLFSDASAALYQAPFSTTGLQASAYGDVFANYPEWSLTARVTEEDYLYEARVRLPGELEVSNLVNPSPFDPSYALNNGRNTVTSTLSSSAIGAGAAFDLSSGALNVNVDVGSRFSSALEPGNFNVGVSIGKIFLTFHPGYEGGAFRIQDASGIITPYVDNTNMDFTPGTGDDFTEVNITTVENGLNYDFSYSIGSYSGVFSAEKGKVDDSAAGISSIGLIVNGYPATANFRDLEITYAIPEPSLAAMAVLPGLALLRRRRA